MLLPLPALSVVGFTLRLSRCYSSMTVSVACVMAATFSFFTKA